MKKLIAIILLALPALFASAQSSDQVFTIVQQMPKFKGDFNEYLQKNIKYPEAERKAGVTGTVYINFVVEKDGSISSAKVLRGVAGGPGLDAEALRVVSGMPKWTPGTQNGQPVRVAFNLPIRFRLEDPTPPPPTNKNSSLIFK